MININIGDVVLCVNDSFCKSYLENGETYVVSDIRSSGNPDAAYYRLDGVSESFWFGSFRFEPKLESKPPSELDYKLWET